MILIIDDDLAVYTSLALLLRRAGHEVEILSSSEKALQYIRRQTPDLMLMDMNFSLSTTGREGIELLQKMQILLPEVPVILMTAWGSISLAVEGMRAGAFDFVTKPWNNRSLLKSIETALEIKGKKALAKQHVESRQSDSVCDFSSIVGKSEALKHVLYMVERIADTNASVLITGESGTGKELIAEAIHRNSHRKASPFVKVNLGGLSQSLFDSEMFGHKKGSFTGAQVDRAGRFEVADGGTIFLDEIGELDLSCQVKLLRVLQDQTFERLGESRPRKVDLRILSATNADLPAMIKARTFREDLYYRINLIQLHLPPLRERTEDIALLAQFFADKQTASNHLPHVDFSPDALELLERLPYYGNIRELKNLIDSSILVCRSSYISAKELEPQIQHQLHRPPENTSFLQPSLDELEAQTVATVIRENNGNLSKAAKRLGISRASLYRRIEKYGL
ncbi:MAG: sigma-54 dependent transcriptional regulator [Porphyromonas sp.]|nr:sigma-54 dependent transcriptional regulator [Porphyromonas sp.]